ncbi:hypothetical protein LO771_14870 [Streptacidiphilus sp. ASG 303]|uniref:hypothetical protein n=1 Tax=Streptacidiphilus sp. ASG 303 TaxID=2896847 RepID=UPI001E28C826|nr:hypothetical protein [Streptacidiphilus sp. ASG 303]MCD0483642.1 hypothetical protein [Streptacidiphilus sp. ASG 303]
MTEWPTGRGTSLSAAQRRVLLEADPVTGEADGSAAALRALAAKGLVAAYGRRGARYLTAFGRQVRAGLEADRRPEQEQDREQGGGRPSGFAAATGGETGTGAPVPGRAAAAAAAWEALLEIRRVTGSGGGPGSGGAARRTPAAWERGRPVPAVALALEAAGVPSAVADASGRRVRAGYRVTAGGGTGSARVEWLVLPGTPAAADEAERRLRECASLLGRWGWEALPYRASGGVRFLEVAPARA